MTRTVASLLTPSAPSGISVIALEGPGAPGILKALFSSTLPRASRAALGRLVHEGKVLDEVLLLPFEGPRFEICCHGGRAPAEAILQALETLGVRIEPWSARLPRNTLDHDLFHDLLRSRGPMQAAVLARLYSGSLKEAFLRVKQALLGGKEELDLCRRLLDSFAAGQYLHRPPTVVIAGPVNAGKSTLFNAVLGERRAITSTIPGTTRDPVESMILLHGFPVRLFDLPGMAGAPSSPLSQMALDAAVQRLADADLVLHVETAKEHRKQEIEQPVLRVINKSDLIGKEARDRLQESDPNVMVLSALREQGIESLLLRMSHLLGFPENGDDDLLYLFNKKQVMLIKKAVDAMENRTDRTSAAALLTRYISSPWRVDLNI
jgi:tRNA modification GTPase